MTERELKKTLLEYAVLEKKIADLYAEIASVRDRVDALREVQSPVLDGMPHGRGVVKDSTFQKARLIVDVYEREMNQCLDAIARLTAKRLFVDTLLERLTTDERRVIEARYFERGRWDTVCGTLFMSRATCFRLRDTAFEKMLGKK